MSPRVFQQWAPSNMQGDTVNFGVVPLSCCCFNCSIIFWFSYLVVFLYQSYLFIEINTCPADLNVAFSCLSFFEGRLKETGLCVILYCTFKWNYWMSKHMTSGNNSKPSPQEFSFFVACFFFVLFFCADINSIYHALNVSFKMLTKWS